MQVVSSLPFTPDKPLMASIGIFDGVHLGHRSLLAQIGQYAGERSMYSAVVTFKEHPKHVLHPESALPLLNTPEERIEKLGEAGIDYVILLDFTEEIANLSALDFLRLLSEKYHVKGIVIGYDHRFGHNRTEGFEQYAAYGKELGIEVIRGNESTYKGASVSSSVIRSLLTNGDVRTAAERLSYPYALQGRVIGGYRIGRKIGFPTANLQPVDRRKIIPMSGVYAVQAVLPDRSVHPGMLNLGQRPTLERPNDYSIEVHLFDFSGDLYGETITVRFIEFLRPERKMSGLEELCRQLRNDEENARKILAGY